MPNPTETDALRLKIEKLLALAASSNPNEAKLAMSRAQALIQKFNIDMDLNADPTESLVIAVEYVPNARIVPGLLPHLPAILHTCCRMFGCYGTITQFGPNFNSLSIWGFPLNIKLAAYTCDAVLAQGLVDYRAEFKEYRSLAFGDGFWNGFSESLYYRFVENIQANEGIVLYDKVKESIMAVGSTSNYEVDQSATVGREAGTQSANSVSLHKPVQAGSLGNLLAGGK